MKLIPFELPIRASHNTLFSAIYSNTGTRICRGLTKIEADYIVFAINSYGKLVDACEKAKWLYDELALSTLGAACKYGDNYQPPTKEDCLNIRELLEQALKQTENPK